MYTVYTQTQTRSVFLYIYKNDDFLRIALRAREGSKKRRREREREMKKVRRMKMQKTRGGCVCVCVCGGLSNRVKMCNAYLLPTHTARMHARRMTSRNGSRCSEPIKFIDTRVPASERHSSDFFSVPASLSPSLSHSLRGSVH